MNFAKNKAFDRLYMNFANFPAIKNQWVTVAVLTDFIPRYHD